MPREVAGTALASCATVLRPAALFVLAWGLAASLGGDARPAGPPELPLPSFAELAVEGAPWLLPAADQERLAGEPIAKRATDLQSLLADPDRATPVNELLEGIRRRRALMLA